jgi:hypothetical protein
MALNAQSVVTVIIIILVPVSFVNVKNVGIKLPSQQKL